MVRKLGLVVVSVIALGGCASLPRGEPLQVTVAGVEALPGEGLELRMNVKLRVQNPNDSQIDYDGVYVKFDVQGRTFASGVSSEHGTVPRFGEGVVTVPISVSVVRMVRQVLGVLDGQSVDRIRYEMSGKLDGSLFHAVRFTSRGEFDIPKPAPATS
jgi:LEA14-like dessication related protein